MHQRNRSCVSGEWGIFSGWSKSRRALIGGAANPTGLSTISRRTAATGMAELGIAPHVIEAVSESRERPQGGRRGHLQSGACYATEMRRALNLWGEHVAAIIEDRAAADNVTTFRAGGG